NNDRLKWLEEKPGNLTSSKRILVHVTILDRKSPEKRKKKGSLVEFFKDSPLYASGIDLEKDKDYGREVNF
ncbi:MAG: hypothetical protein MUF15_21210, partial [Acidobacteria bacterium]|nr:hypothetical protein [Acidobacteriota bacterium]